MMHKFTSSIFWGILALFALPALAFAHDASELTALQNFAGYVNLANFIWIISVFALAGGICFIFWGVIETILKMHSLMEALAWAGAIGGSIGSYFLPEPYQYLTAWTVPLGAVMIAIAISVSGFIRKVEPNPTNFSATLMLLWGAIAVFYGSSLVGFIAVGAMMSFLGFSMAVTPFCHAFGFKDKEALARGTMAGILVASAYAIRSALGWSNEYTQVFETGALYLGTFVAGIGILILASKWHEENTYVAGNILAIMVFGGGTALSLLFGIQEISTMLIVFGLLYVTEKIIEIPIEGAISFGVKLMVAGGILFYGWKWISENPNIIAQFQNLS